ncbi:MAG: hypothetical protein AAFU78_02385, partial [Cyanobacteria bacterium J06633_2]
MIDWIVRVGNKEYREGEWYFDSFLAQHYILPIINVGKSFIDDYGATTFDKEDCIRIKGNIEYWKLNHPKDESIQTSDNNPESFDITRFEKVQTCRELIRFSVQANKLERLTIDNIHVNLTRLYQ